MLLVFVVRLAIAIVCAVSLVLMVRDFLRRPEDTTVKTNDLMYSRFFWVLAGLSGTVEGMVRQSPFRYSVILLAAASFVTLKALVHRGPWGGDE